MADALHTGAQALQALLTVIKDLSDATVLPMGMEWEERIAAAQVVPDFRDYRTMAVVVEASLRINLLDREAEHREGFLRALTDLLCREADENNRPEEWDPIEVTTRSFAEGVAHG